MLMQNLKILLVVLGTLGLYTWVANAIPQIESEVPTELAFGADVAPEELVRAGEELYAGAGQCTSCHGLGTRAPNLLTDHEGEGTIGQRCGGRVPGEDCKTYLHRSMIEPAAYLVQGFGPIMPDQRINLSNNQIWALVAFLQDQGGQVTVTGADLASEAPSPAAAPAPAAPASTSLDPLELLRSNACLGCHLLGDEGVQLGPPLSGIGARVTADYIRESILDPAAGVSEGYESVQGLMPPIFGQSLTAAQLEAIVRFLAEQR
ncbi:MAG TPA: c-type cytochrome [Longimicrobiales bacterium]|jgi:mono/diheme cytochrome c family protein